MKQDRHRVNLFTRRAGRVPNPDEGVSSEERNNLRPEGEIETGVTKHRRDVDRKHVEESFKARGVVEKPGLQTGDGFEALSQHAFTYSPLE